MISHPTFDNLKPIQLAVAAAKAALSAWSQTSFEERRHVLNAVKVAYEVRLDDLATAIMQELGCPSDLSRDAKAMAGLGTLNAFIEALDELHLVGPTGPSVHIWAGHYQPKTANSLY